MQVIRETCAEEEGDTFGASKQQLLVNWWGDHADGNVVGSVGVRTVAFGRYSVELLRSTESLFGTEVVVENSEIWEVKVKRS